ncbi:hypothetical protein C7S18_04620 [Ahniella affigens]|uniref:Peptidase S8/S53 domain-containing protein n=1 Tax=Ahniella affigens TaxID=2021234 RepID=A0A2P1PNX7_9GAMM|nr:S8 family serine peptidase [Ahniella affigens]AVP96525.1 hypothetical protein C7S18_04620 [Ahniella affigens]
MSSQFRSSICQHIKLGALVAALALPLYADAGSQIAFTQVPTLSPDAAAPINQLMIKSKQGMGSKPREKGDPAKQVSAWSAIIGRPLSLVRIGTDGVWVVAIGNATTRGEVDSISNTLKAADPNVQFVHADLAIVSAAVPSDPLFPMQWHLGSANAAPTSVNLPLAWDFTRGAGVTVAVLDSGYRPHPDLVGNILTTGYDFMSAYDYDAPAGRDNSPLDPIAMVPGGGGGPVCPVRPCPAPQAPTPWHGTHVAGIIAATGNNGIGVAGTAYEAKILPVRVISPGGGVLSDLVDAIRWTAGEGVDALPAQGYPRAQVINMSLSSLFPEACPNALQDAINLAYQRGISIVVAAGNQEGDATNYFPANCANVLPVAAIARNGTRASYSNTVGAHGVAAPGGTEAGDVGTYDGILSTYNNGLASPGADTYYNLKGTSMAAPQVAGTAALIHALRPTWTPAEVYQQIRSKARSHIGANCNSSTCGAGLADAGRAVSDLGGLQSMPLRPGHSGTWYDPNQSGQGFMINVSAAASYVYAGWYSFAVDGQPGPTGQRWYSAQAQNVAMGSPFVDLKVYQNTGGRFNSLPPTSAAQIGTARLTFQSCNVANFNYTVTVDGAPRSNTIQLVRLIADQNCDSNFQPIVSLNQQGINATLNGAWYNPPTAGQGFQFEFAPNLGNFFFAAWYTYAVDGQPGTGPSGQRWLTIQGNYPGNSRTASGLPIYETLNGKFNTTTPTTTVQVGTADLYVQTCSRAFLTYHINGRPSATIQLDKLVGASGCIE